MEKLYILKKVDNVNHVIGRLTQTDSGDFEIESLLEEEGSEIYGIPVLKENGKNNERLARWVASFLPPLGNVAFTQALIVSAGIREFNSPAWVMTWLKTYKPDGRNTISFCGGIPPDCVRHELPFKSVDEFEDADGFVFDSVDYSPDHEENDGYYIGYDVGYYDDEEDDEDDEDEEDYEPQPYSSAAARSDSFPVYPENIPSEQPLTDAKAFAQSCGKPGVENLQTIHNTFKALAKCLAVDFVGTHPCMSDFAGDMHIPTDKLSTFTIRELVKLHGDRVTAHTAVPQYYTKGQVDLLGYLSYDLRGDAGNNYSI